MAKEKKKSVLIVDDEKELTDILAFKFEEEGFEVISAYDGEQGLSDALKYKPDMILLDIIMPKMDGITVMKKLRDDQWGKDVPVIVLTNLSAADTAKDIGSKSQDYLVKAEWKLTDVVAKVKARLKIK